VKAGVTVIPSLRRLGITLTDSTPTGPSASTDDVARAYRALQGKQDRYATLWRYHDGDHPLIYSSSKLRSVFERIDARWCENWAAVVIDSLIDRVQLTGFRCKDKTIQAALDAWWDSQDMAADAEEIAKSVAVCAEGFLIAELNDAGEPRTFENQPHLCAMVYGEDDPKTPEYAAKWWEEGKRTYLNLYYPERILHFVAASKRSDISNPSAFAPEPENPEEVNSLGAIPVFHYRVDRRGKGKLTDVIPLNNALNKLFADMMVSAEYGAFKQRYIIGDVDFEQSGLKNAPNEIWPIPAGDGEGQATSVGQFEATDLANFIAGLDHIASRIAILSHTPKHYLLQAGDVSGEALIAMEAPLVKEAARYMARLAVTWKHAAAFVMRLSGHSVTADDIECIWEDEHTVQPYTESLIHKTNVDAGVPIVTQLRREGWSDAELAQMQKDMDEAQAGMTSLADVAISRARKEFDQGANPGPYPTPGMPTPGTQVPDATVPPTQAPKAKRAAK